MSDLVGLARPTLDVGIVVHDVDATPRFYAETLGLPEDEPMPIDAGSVRRFRVGGSSVDLMCLDSPPAAGDAGLRRAIGYRLVTVVLPEIDDVLARAEVAGAAVRRRTCGDGRDAVPSALVSDPDGNALELAVVPGVDPFVQIGLAVADVADASVFYAHTLDLRTVPSTRVDDVEVRNVLFGRTGVKFWRADASARLGGEPFTARAGIRYVTARVACLSATLDRLRGRGLDVALGPLARDGDTVAFITDPDGNWIELLERG